MPKSKLRVERPPSEVWAELQQLTTWEGIGGLTDLRGATHDDVGDLTGFTFSLDTPLGLISDRATVRGADREMVVVAEAKGLEVAVRLSLRPADGGGATDADFSIEGRSTSFLTRVLAGTLQRTLESGIERERDRMAARLDPT